MPSKKQSSETSRQPVAEWITAGVGLLLVLGALGVVIASALAPRTPPSLEVEVVSVLPAPSGHKVEVEVSNTGSDTAAAVEIEGRLGAETARATVDYVPGRGQARTTLVFAADPRQGVLALSVKGWSEP